MYQKFRINMIVLTALVDANSRWTLSKFPTQISDLIGHRLHFSMLEVLTSKAAKAQVWPIKLTMAAFHLGELVLGLWCWACSITDLAYWDTLLLTLLVTPAPFLLWPVKISALKRIYCGMWWAQRRSQIRKTHFKAEGDFNPWAWEWTWRRKVSTTACNLKTFFYYALYKGGANVFLLHYSVISCPFPCCFIHPPARGPPCHQSALVWVLSLALSDKSTDTHCPLVSQSTITTAGCVACCVFCGIRGVSCCE